MTSVRTVSKVSLARSVQWVRGVFRAQTVLQANVGPWVLEVKMESKVHKVSLVFEVLKAFKVSKGRAAMLGLKVSLARWVSVGPKVLPEMMG